MKRGKPIHTMTAAETHEELIIRTIKYNEPYVVRRDPTTSFWALIHVDPLDKSRHLVKEGMSKEGATLWAERLSRAWALGRISKNVDS